MPYREYPGCQRFVLRGFRSRSVRTLRFDDYELRATVGRAFFVAWATGPSTQQMVLKYKVKIAHYRLQTTKKEPRQTPHYKVRLVFIFSSQKLPFEKARDTLVLLFNLADEIMS